MTNANNFSTPDDLKKFVLQKLVTGETMDIDFSYYPCSQFEEDKLQTGVVCETSQDLIEQYWSIQRSQMSDNQLKMVSFNWYEL
jgi:hypothetical protein